MKKIGRSKQIGKCFSLNQNYYLSLLATITLQYCIKYHNHHKPFIKKSDETRLLSFSNQ